VTAAAAAAAAAYTAAAVSHVVRVLLERGYDVHVLVRGPQETALSEGPYRGTLGPRCSHLRALPNADQHLKLFGHFNLLEPASMACAFRGCQVRNTHLWSAVDPTLSSPLPFYGPLTVAAAFRGDQAVLHLAAPQFSGLSLSDKVLLLVAVLLLVCCCCCYRWWSWCCYCCCCLCWC